MKSFYCYFSLLATLTGAAPHPYADVRATGYWYESITHNGVSPTLSNTTYVIFRNVKDFGAKGDGTTDDTAAIQRAINDGGRNGNLGTTTAPAVIYFPLGTYVVSRSIQNYVDTVIMGNPIDRPVIKAASRFANSTLLIGQDPNYSGLVGFYHEIKNLVFDTTAIPSKTITILSWSISQGCQVSNILFNMAPDATGHTGITSSGLNSPLLLNDLQFVGGGVGYSVVATQYHFKNLYFKNIITGLALKQVVQATGQGLRFEGVTTGIDTTGSNSNGILSLIDSSATNTSTLINAGTTSTASNSLVLENVIVDSSVAATVKVGGSAVLKGSVTPGQTWIRGHAYQNSSTSPQTIGGQLIKTSRPTTLVNSTGFYYTVAPPTYQEYDISQVVNVKTVPAHPVRGDGSTDDTASLQAIINAAASAKQVVYFPHGIYIVTDTLLIPPGSLIYGEAWTQIAASGDKFRNASQPRAMVKVGSPGDVGVAQMTDFLFTVADVLPGTKMVEVNMAGEKPGDAGFFNCHFRIGGAKGSKIEQCSGPATCAAAHLSAHFTPSSSVYWENSWSWSADHDLDRGTSGQPSDAGGWLIESQKGVWMLGIGSEHHALYQVSIANAKNVFVGLQQGESAYWQVQSGAPVINPAPWTNSLLLGEPDFAWCGATDNACRVGVYQRVINSSDINLYSSGFWNFPCQSDACQTNAVIYEGNTRLFSYGVSVINSKNIILEKNVSATQYSPIATRAANVVGAFNGFQPGVVAAYLRQSS